MTQAKPTRKDELAPDGRSWLGAAMAITVLVLLGGWATMLLARGKPPPPPLAPYAIPTISSEEPLPAPPGIPLAGTQILRFVNSAEPETLDPALMKAVPDLTVALALFEGLTSLHPKTLTPVPGIAERWDISPDGRTYTFHLRRSRWSDGQPLTAHDFAYAWRRALEPETRSAYSYVLYPIENAEAFNTRKLHDFSLVGVKALDDRTLQVRLDHPVPYFLELTAFATYAPVRKDAIDAHGDRWTRPGHLVSNGPFALTDWRQRERIIARKNPHYWDAGRVRLQEIDFLPIDDSETALKKYLNREVHWIRDVPAPKVTAAARLPGFRYSPLFATYFYRFNVTRPPLDDPRVRRALALAVDKESIARYLLRAGQRPARGFVPPLLPTYTPVEGPACDPAEARRLLAEAGFPGGRGFPRLELLYNTSEAHQLVAEALQHMWQTALGIRIDLLNQESKVYLDSMARLQYDIARSSWTADYNDPMTFLDLFVTGGGNNRTGWSHPRYDECIRLAAREANAARRQTLLQEAERILVCDEMPILPLYFFVNIYLVDPQVIGVYDNSRNLHPFQYIALAADSHARPYAPRGDEQSAAPRPQ